MIYATQKGYWMYRNDGVEEFDRKTIFKFGFEKKGIFNKIPFLHKV